MAALFYSLLIFIYKQATRLASLLNRKAKRKITGLSKQHKDLQHQLQSLSEERILVHCASLGEYEQASPIIEWILDHTKYNIIISFFSSSGHDNCTLVSNRCMKCYLPFDLNREMNRFIITVNPSKVIITKNEWWWNLLHILRTEKIPSYLVSSTIRKDHYFIKYPISFFRDGFKAFDTAFVLNKDSADNLSDLFNGQVIPSGDTRKDKVVSTKNNNLENNIIKNTLIYGSIWLHDLPIIKAIIKSLPDYNHFIYPHELGKDNIETLRTELECNVITELSETGNKSISIINSMGQLKSDYAKASLVYIGGGFGDGIHNILEAAVYGIPTIFGPRHQKSVAAQELIESQTAFSISNPKDVNTLLKTVLTNESLQTIHMKLKAYFSATNSPTEIICSKIFK